MDISFLHIAPFYTQVLHNIAIVENFQDGFSNPKRFLEALDSLKVCLILLLILLFAIKYTSAIKFMFDFFLIWLRNEMRDLLIHLEKIQRH